MKKKLLLLMLFVSLFAVSCTKDDDAGILIDGNGKPRTQNMQSSPGVSSQSSAKGDSTILSDYGIAIDPDGRPAR